MPKLNWKELSLLCQQVGPEVEGLFVDRIIVPERDRLPDGFLKGEWAIRLTGRKQECALLLSIRPRHPYIAWCAGKGPKASSKATRSPFDLSMSKHLKGAKLLKVESLHKERVVIFWFSEEGTQTQQIGLVLVLIPAAPEAFLVSVPIKKPYPSAWTILARSRTIREESKEAQLYIPPNGHQAPEDPPVRKELVESAQSLFLALEKLIASEAFALRCQNAEKALKALIKQARDRLRQSETSLREAQHEEDWQKCGDLLKASLGQLESFSASMRKVMDYELGKEVEIRCDPKLNLKAQVEKFYQNAKRKQRRIQEATSRIERFREVSLQLENSLAQKPQDGDWKSLEKLERLAQTSPTAPVPAASSKKAISSWLGKSFTSKEGHVIWVGRSKDENLELTFKSARGNDLWMHVRGRPGAHVVIPLQSGKSAPLDTLLDAATLVIHYSGGQNWGKTEVDYTFKKYVKRIKDSSEASYTNNKTLLVEMDQGRLQRLLSQS